MRTATDNQKTQQSRAFYKKYAAEILLITLASFYYFCFPERQVPWNDEVFSILDARKLTGINLLIRPTFYFIFRIWLALGDSLLWMRALAACFSIATLVLIYRFASYLLGKKIGFVSAILLLLSVVARNHAHEVRMYSMGTFLSLAGSFALAKSLEQRSTKLLTTWAVLRLLAVWTIPFSVLLFLPDTLFALWSYHRDRNYLLHFFSRMVAVIVVWSPSLYYLEQEKNKFFSDWVSLRDRPDFLGALDLFFNKFTFGALGLESQTYYWLALTGVALVMSVPFLLKKYRHLIWVCTWGAVPFTILIFYSIFAGNLWLPRYFLFSQPYILTLVAAGLVVLWENQKALAILAALAYAGLAFYNLANPKLSADHSQASYELTQTIMRHEEPSDHLVLLAAEPSRYADLLNYFYKGQLHFVDSDELGRNGDHWTIDESRLEQFFKRITIDKKRIWLAYRSAGLSPEDIKKVRKFINQHFQVLERHDFYLMGVSLLLPK